MAASEFAAWLHQCGALNTGPWTRTSSCVGCRFDVSDPHPGEVKTLHVVVVSDPAEQ